MGIGNWELGFCVCGGLGMTSTSMIDVGGECNGRRPIDAWCMMRTESIVNVMVFYFPSYSYSYSFIILSLNTIQYETYH